MCCALSTEKYDLGARILPGKLEQGLLPMPGIKGNASLEFVGELAFLFGHKKSPLTFCVHLCPRSSFFEPASVCREGRILAEPAKETFGPARRGQYAAYVREWIANHERKICAV
jgi:hypothetical protein